MNRKTYIIICIVMFWLIAALRNVNWADSLHLDAAGYSYSFSRDRGLNWNNIFTVFINRYIYRVSENDIGYIVLEKIIGIITHDYNVFSLIIDALFFVPFGLLINRYNRSIPQIMLAFLLYIALFQTNMISGGRQMFALGLDIISLLYAMDKKWRKVVVSFLLGLTIHFSSLLMILPILLIYFKVKPKTIKMLHSVTFLAFPLVYLFPNQVIRFLSNLVGIKKYAAYGLGEVRGGANTFIILAFMLTLFCFIAMTTQYLMKKPEIQNLYTNLPFLTIFAPLIRSNGSMIRICIYFFIYLTVLFPHSMDLLFKHNNRHLAYTFVVVALIFLTVRGGVMDYHFMWQSF